MVPERIDKKVNLLLRKISSPYKPIYVPIHPELYAQVNECINAVQNKIKNDGGSMIYGWQIWQISLICEAEFHAVWKSPSGEMIDITPKQIQLKEILFLQDDRIRYDGSQIDNKRINNTSNILVDDLIAIFEARFKIMNKGERAYCYSVKLDGVEAKLYNYLNYMRFKLEEYINRGANLYSPCFCGSNEQYNKCHRNDLYKAFAMV